jgi:hypothetical protein
MKYTCISNILVHTSKTGINSFYYQKLKHPTITTAATVVVVPTTTTTVMMTITTKTRTTCSGFL